MHEVLVYSRKGCHLCDVVKDQLAELQPGNNFDWREIDIDTHPELVKRYNDEIPVIFMDGRKAFKYRIDPAQFLKTLKART